MTIKEEEKCSLFNHMAALDSDTLPNGAWQAMLEDTVRFWNDINHGSFDPYTMFLEYLEWRKGL